MHLERSRTALRQASQTVEELRAAKNKPELFRDMFPLAMGAVQRVGSIIAAETEGRRTSEFGMWWKQTQSDPLHTFMRDVRNAEFKRGESRQQATYVKEVGSIHISSSVAWEHRDKDGRVLGRRRRWDPPFEPPPGPQTTVVQSTDWHFSGGGNYDGQEVLSVLDRYLTWLRDVVLPTAERLTR